MAKAQRMGDPNTGGGKIMMGNPTVLINGRNAAAGVVPVSPHGKGKHAAPFTQPNSSCKVLVGGKPMVTSGTSDTCGHSRMQGSTDVIIGD